MKGRESEGLHQRAEIPRAEDPKPLLKHVKKNRLLPLCFNFLPHEAMCMVLRSSLDVQGKNI